MIGNDTIEIVKRTTTDQYDRLNSPIPGPPTYVTVPGCSIQIASADEDTKLTTIVDVTAKVFMPITDDTITITSRDAIRYGTRTFEVTGPSLVATDADGTEDHAWCLIQWQAG